MAEPNRNIRFFEGGSVTSYLKAKNLSGPNQFNS